MCGKDYETAIQSMHDKKYTQMQYRVWSEMHVGGVHADLNEAPSAPMFVRAGGVEVEVTLYLTFSLKPSHSLHLL